MCTLQTILRTVFSQFKHLTCADAHTPSADNAHFMSTPSRPSAEEVQTSLNDILIALVDSDDFLDRFPDIELGEDGYVAEGAATIHEYSRSNDGNGLRVVLAVNLPQQEEQQKYEVFLCAHPNSLTCEEVSETLEEMDEHLKIHVNEESISSSDNDEEMGEEDEEEEEEEDSEDDMDVDPDSKAKPSNSDRPFKCSNCGFRFTQRWSLTRHMQSMPCMKGQVRPSTQEPERK